METFFGKLKSAIESMWKKAPAVEVAAASTINYIVPFVEELDTMVTPELAPVINPILDKVKTGFSALAVTIKGVGPAANVQTITASIKANLTALVSAAQVKDTALASKIGNVTNLIAAEVDAIAVAHAS
jgi:hypothetical protein